MATKKVEVDERVIAVKSQMDGKVYEIIMLKKQKAEILALCDVRIEEIKASADGKVEKIDAYIEQLESELRVLFDQVPSKEAKTQFKVTLLSGDVVVKKPFLDIDPKKDILLKNVETNGLSEFVKIKEVREFDWAGLKKVLKIQEDGSIIHTKTGEVLEIEGLEVVTKPEQLVIK